MSFPMPKGIRDIRTNIIDQYFMKATNFWIVIIYQKVVQQSSYI